MPEPQRRLSLPAPHLPAVPETYHIAPPAPEAETQEAPPPLSQYLWIIKRHRWKILAFVLTAVIATLVVSSRITPVYESTATVDIDRRMPTGIIGQEALQASPADSDQFLATQVRLIQSDSVLRPVAQRFRLLDTEEAPSWGAPQPADAEDAPVKLKKLKVTRPPNTYLLLISYRSTDPHLAADVANAIAQSYLEHTYNIRYRFSASLSAFMEKQLEELKAKMERSSSALAQFERELNVINPEEKTSILSARLLQLNTEFTHAQADRVRKEAAHQSVRGGSLEAAQVSTQGEALRRVMERVDEAQARFADVKIQYGVNHPEYRKAASQLAEAQVLLQQTRRNIAQRVQIEYGEAVNREAMLKQAVNETKAEFDRLNARSFEYQALKREAEADKKLYEELVRKIKEAGINAGFQNSSIRIADPARPPIKPVFPNLKLNLALALLLASVLAVGAAVLHDVLDNTVHDPEQVARTLRTEVVGNLPLVRSWRGRLAPIPVNSNGHGELAPLSESADRTVSTFGEAIRTLRNSVLLADFDGRLRSVLVTSASPGEGKSTVAAHLAISHAQQRKRTLLIDADLRRPSVHKRFQLPTALGLSDVLVSGTPWQEVRASLVTLPELDLLPAGPPARRAADLIGPGLARLVEEASAEYDLVVLDAPPLLGFAEPLQMAAVVDGVIIVARAGQTNRQAVASVLASLQRLRANVVGLVLNEVHRDVSDSYHYYGYYGKYYKHCQPHGD